jgi:hypothetical protein
LAKQYNSYIGPTFFWNIQEDGVAASITIPRVLQNCAELEVMSGKPDSIHTWVNNFMDRNRDRVSQAAEAGLKTCMGVNSTDGSRYPTVVGVVNCESAVELPKPFQAKEINKVFVRIAEVGVCKDDGEAWPYNSMSGLLISWIGENSVTIFDEESSNASGSDAAAFLSKTDVSQASSKGDKKDQVQAKWSTVLLKEKMCCWVPFGCVTSIVPLASRRESKTETADKKKKPGRSTKKDDAEYSTLVWIPVLSNADADAAPKTVCQVMSRWMAHKHHGPDRWEKFPEWKHYCSALDAVVKKTSKKIGDEILVAAEEALKEDAAVAKSGDGG